MLWQSHSCQVLCRHVRCQVWGDKAARLCARGHASCLVLTGGETELLTLFFTRRHVNPRSEDSVQAAPVEPSLLPGGWSRGDKEHVVPGQPQPCLLLCRAVGDALSPMSKPHLGLQRPPAKLVEGGAGARVLLQGSLLRCFSKSRGFGV